MPQALQIRYRSVLEFDSPDISSKVFIDRSHEFLKHKTYSGQITKHAKRRMERCCELFLQSSPIKYVYNPYRNLRHRHHMSFITLTIQVQEYNLCELKRNVFGPWLKKMQRNYNLKKYIWKLEFTKNGMPHFHLITDAWIDYKFIRKEWNLLLSKHGYLNAYFKTHSHYNANSTDVKSSKNQKRSVAYMVKYICKDLDSADKVLGYFDSIGTDKIGKLWDCSFSLKRFKYYRTFAQSWHDEALNLLVEQKKVLKKCFDRFNLYIFKYFSPLQILSAAEKQEYNFLINQINTS